MSQFKGRSTPYSANNPEYVFQLEQSRNLIAASGSDSLIKCFDPQTLQCISSLPTGHSKINGIRSHDDLIYTIGEEGALYSFDMRSGKKNSIFKAMSSLLAIDCKGNSVVVGSEAANNEVSVYLFDIRAQSSITFDEHHHDDIMAISFHPQTASQFLVGDGDGVVSLYDTASLQAEDVVVQAINHGASISKLGWTSPTKFYAASHMETLAIYGIEHDTALLDYGDIRQALTDCDYIADILHIDERVMMVCGSHSLQDAKLIPLESALQPVAHLHAAHGDELVRTALYINGTLYTGGEDNLIISWSEDKKSRRSGNRFAPY